MRYFFREWRQHAGLTLKDMGDILGISEGHVLKIEKNQRDFTGDYLEDFAKIVGCGEKIWYPLCTMPPEPFVNRVGKLTPHEKLVIRRRLQTRSWETRKLRRADLNDGREKKNGGKPDPGAV